MGYPRRKYSQYLAVALHIAPLLTHSLFNSLSTLCRQQRLQSARSLFLSGLRLKRANIPKPYRLICGPREYVSLLKRRLPRPRALDIKPIRQILQASRALEDGDFLAGDWVLVFERRDHALRVDFVEPLVLGINYRDDVREVELGGEDEGLDVVDVVGLVGYGEEAGVSEGIFTGRGADRSNL